jgi:hypothetical protein
MAGYDDFSTPAVPASDYDAFSVPAATPREDKRYSSFGRFAPVARGIEDISNLAGDPFGVRDEIVGAGAFLKRLVTSKGSLGEAAKAYSEAAGDTRAETRDARDTYGMLPEIVGGMGTAALSKTFKMAPTLMGRVAQSAKAGAGYGAAAGVGRSEGGVRERIEGAGFGAATGAAFGPLVTEVAAPAIGAAVRGSRAGAKTLGNAVQYVRGRRANADARLNRALEQQNTPPAQALQRLDEVETASKLGRTQRESGFTLADTGPVMQDLADTAALVSKEARGISGGFLRNRAREQFARVNDYVQRSLKVTRKDFARTKAKLVDEQQRLSKDAYDDFRNMDVTIPVGDVLYSRQIDDLAAAPALKRVLQQAREQFVAATTKRDLSAPARQTHGRQVEQLRGQLNEARDTLRDLQRQRQDAASRGAKLRLRDAVRRQEDLVTELSRDLQSLREGKPAAVYAKQNYTELTPARFDAGKRALDDMIESAMKAGRGNEARLLIKLKNELVDVADRATTLPGTNRSLYAEARDVYGSRAELLESLDAGRAFMRGDAEVTGAQYQQLSTGEKQMFRIGMARELRKTLGRKQLGHDMIGFFDRPNIREAMEEIMSPAAAKQFYQLVEIEQAMAATNQAVRGNSKTAQRQQDVLDFSFGVRLGRAIKDQGLVQALRNEVFDQVTRFFAMRESDAVLLTRMLFETDIGAQRQILQRLAQTYGTRSATAMVNRAQRIARVRVANARRSLAALTGEYAGQVSAQEATPYRRQP